MYEETAPYGLVAESPRTLRRQELLRNVPGVRASEVEAAIHGYQHRHDLAAGLKGLALDPVWLTRSGRPYRVEGREIAWCALDQVVETLETFANAVAQAVESGPAPRAAEALRLWSARRPSHEIMHVLVDRRGELPAAEVFGGATPAHLEQRARAFAAELLLPREIAAAEVARSEGLEETAKELRERYGVSQEVVGWQLHNGPALHALNAAEIDLVKQWTRQFERPMGFAARAPRRPALRDEP